MDNQQDYDARRRKRRMRRGLRRFLVLFVTVVVLLGVAVLVTAILQRASNSGGVIVKPPVDLAVSSQSSLPSAPQSGSADSSLWNVLGPVQQNPDEMQLVTPDYRMLALPENGRVDMSYFDTVTFVGDSITQGLELYQTVPNAKYCAYKGVGPKQIYDGSVQKKRISNTEVVDEIPLDALLASAPDNVYVLLGTNAMVGMDDESLLAYYSEMLDQLRTHLNAAVGIYVQSITPVLPETSRFDITRIHTLNNALAKMASEKGVYFLDLHEALAGEDTYLRAEFGASRDGYHLSPAGYEAWKDYLITHTAYNERNPYLEGSDYYSQVLPVVPEAPLADPPLEAPSVADPPVA